MRQRCFIPGELLVLRHALICLIAVLGAIHVAPAFASFGDCADPAYRALFDPRLETVGFDCVERVRVDVPTEAGIRSVRLIHDRNAGWAILPGVVAEFERGIRAAAEASRQLGSFRLTDVTIFLIDDLPPREGASETFSDIAASAGADDNECRIGVYLLGSGATAAHAAYVAAHEIFHCVQYATLDAAQMRTSGGGLGAGGDWWMEGSADWFAALALPEAELLNIRIAASYLTAPLTAEITAIAETDHATLRGDGKMTVQTSGRWSAEAGKLNLCQDQLHSTGTLRARSSDGMNEMFQMPIPDTPGVVTLDFTCTDSTLETRLPIPDVPEPIVTQYSRIGASGD